MKKTILSVFICLVLILCACKAPTDIGSPNDKNDFSDIDTTLGDGDDKFTDDRTESEIYEGFFDGDTSDVVITCLSGSQNCYSIDNGTVTFTPLSEDSVYSISGKLKGNIVIDAGEGFKLDLELHGLSLVCDNTNPITVKSGDNVSIVAKNSYENYIYDTREAIDGTDETLHPGAIYSEVDLEIGGKGALTVVSENNNGIQTKDDLTVKNLTLYVSCKDNALKGNDSVTLESRATTLIATKGDGIKTSSSDISAKGKQRGSVTVSGGSHTIYAACDGIDAAFDAIVEGENTLLSIFTDKYSSYSEEITAVTEDQYYIRFSSNAYSYSIKYYNSEKDLLWVNAEYHSKASGGRSTYYYYSFPKLEEYEKFKFFMYSSDMTQGQEEDYLVASDYLTPSDTYDTFALSNQGGSLRYTWTNYTTTVQEGGMGRPGMGGMGLGGMGEGNTDKGDHSTKGIKAANEIKILSGNVTVKSYDDALHANNDIALESGAAPLGNVTVSGGCVTIYSNDDGIHADGEAAVSGGEVIITNSYEALEGTRVCISGGALSAIASDDGINATATTGNGVEISGGRIYIYCGGDGIDSNSRTSYEGIIFSGGDTVVISTSGGNSAIDTEQGYSYNGGRVVAIMPSGGMTNEATNCKNFSSVAVNKTLSLSAESFLSITADGEPEAVIRIPKSISGRVIYLGSNSVSFASDGETGLKTDRNGVYWK